MVFTNKERMNEQINVINLLLYSHLYTEQYHQLTDKQQKGESSSEEGLYTTRPQENKINARESVFIYSSSTIT